MLDSICSSLGYKMSGCGTVCDSEIQIKPNPVIEIEQGKLEGFVLNSRESKEYFGFYGIPFAKKPERFQPPERWEAWSGTLDATKAKERSPQMSLIMRRIFGSEDCLFLNIFTPYLPEKPQSVDPRCHNSHSHNGHKHHHHNQGQSSNSDRKLLPVMVFIYGGGFCVGGGDLYGGKYLVDQDIIVVTFNYRLGVLGFLNTGDGLVSGNMGMKDQVMCLSWVQENIHHFGGDSDQVTLCGESAGAASVHYHILSPMSKGLFHKAIMMSGTAISPWAFVQKPVDKVKELAQRLGLECDLEDMGQIVEALKKVHPYALAAQRLNYEEWKDQPQIHFAPTVELQSSEPFLTQSPFDILESRSMPNQVPFLMGVTADEGVYRAIPLLQNPARLKAINENWLEESPAFLYFNKNNVQNHEEYATGIRKFYFGDQQISLETRERLTDLVSDWYFNYNTKLSAIYHNSCHTEENPIYLYVFAYPGEFSYLNSYSIFETYGAGHADDLQYLMNNRIFYSKIVRGTPDDFMIGKMTEMWANFCKTGTPSHSGEDYCWEPMPLTKPVEGKLELEEISRPLRYYQIDQTDGMIDEPFKSRMGFWDSLPYVSS